MTSPQTSRSESMDDPQASYELERVAMLLRSLPDPEVPEGIADRVMTEVRRREERPRVIRLAFAAASRPTLSTALAAGLACLAVFATVRGGLLEPNDVVRPKLVPSVARPIDVAEDSTARTLPARRPLVTEPVALYAGEVPDLALSRSGAPVLAVNDVFARRLDRQLNRLLLNPEGFYGQIERQRNSDVVIARLADRAAERGDAIGVALRLRETAPHHPTTAHFVEKLFGAVLERSVSDH